LSPELCQDNEKRGLFHAKHSLLFFPFVFSFSTMYSALKTISTEHNGKASSFTAEYRKVNCRRNDLVIKQRYTTVVGKVRLLPRISQDNWSTSLTYPLSRACSRPFIRQYKGTEPDIPFADFVMPGSDRKSSRSSSSIYKSDRPQLNPATPIACPIFKIGEMLNRKDRKRAEDFFSGGKSGETVIDFETRKKFEVRFYSQLPTIDALSPIHRANCSL